MPTIDEKIENGIKSLEYYAKAGVLPKNWRSQLNLDEVRFSYENIDNIIPAKLFGSIGKVRQLTSFGIPGTLSVCGFIATRQHGTIELKKAWKNRLSTESNWSKPFHNIFPTYARKVHGVKFEIIRTFYYNVYQDGERVGGAYASLDSAKRAVRKMTKSI